VPVLLPDFGRVSASADEMGGAGRDCFVDVETESGGYWFTAELTTMHSGGELFGTTKPYRYARALSWSAKDFGRTLAR